MKLWILRPIEGTRPDPWSPWYDRCFGFVVRASDEAQAREFAAENGGAENPSFKDTDGSPWLNSMQSTCEELTSDGEPGVIMEDVHSA